MTWRLGTVAAVVTFGLLVGAVDLFGNPLTTTFAGDAAAPIPWADCTPPTAPERAHQSSSPGHLGDVVAGRPLELGYELRAVALGDDSIGLYVSGVLVDERARRGSGAYSLQEIVELVDDDEWIRRVAPGVYEARTALAQAPGSALVIGPDTELRLVDDPGVMLYGRGATLTVTRSQIRSYDPTLDDFDRNAADGRPFLTYGEGSHVTIERAELIGLGSDRSLSYGLTFRDAETVVEVRDSYIAHNFFGVYTSEARGVVIDGNVFELNEVYGIDPHSDSQDLLIRGNVARCNGRHGIIISGTVTDSTIVDNESYANGVNGIVVDRGSDGAVVENNLVWGNGGDGIVVTDSARAVIEGNRVELNRIGIRLSQPGTRGTEVRGNRVESNRIGFESSPATDATRLAGNRWRNNVETGLIIGSDTTMGGAELVAGSVLGLDVRGTLEVDGLEIDGVANGATVRAGGTLVAVSTSIHADDTAVTSSGSRDVELFDSELVANRPFAGAVELMDSTTSDDLTPSRAARRLLLVLSPIVATTWLLTWLRLRKSEGAAPLHESPVR